MNSVPSHLIAVGDQGATRPLTQACETLANRSAGLNGVYDQQIQDQSEDPKEHPVIVRANSVLMSTSPIYLTICRGSAKINGRDEYWKTQNEA